MQSPTKLKQRLTDLLGPPGPDADPLELTLRTVVAMTGPQVEGFVGTMTPEELDRGLEGVAVFFLRIRSDEAPFSIEFLEELGKLQAQARAFGATVQGTATEEPHALAAPAPAEPAPSRAPDAPAAPGTPAAGPESVPPAPPTPTSSPTPTSPTSPTSPDTAPGSSTPAEPAPESSPSSPASPASSEPSTGSGSEPGSTGERPPAPPWPLY